MTTREREQIRGLVDALELDATELRERQAEGVTELVVDINDQMRFNVFLQLFLEDLAARA